MPTPAWDDLDAFVSTDDFAVQIILQMQDGTTRSFAGIFDEPYLNAQLGEYEADTSRPRVACKEADVLGVTRGDRITLDGKIYDVLSAPHIDGTGFASLELASTELQG
jgi:hypothetical protein